MNLIEKDAQLFFNLLKNGGIIMICGALRMQHDVEELLENICKTNGTSLEHFKHKNQILTDCY